MILGKYTAEQLASIFEAVNEKGALAFLVLEIQRLSDEIEYIKSNTDKKPVGRPRGSFKEGAPSKGYTPVGDKLDDKSSHTVVGE